MARRIACLAFAVLALTAARTALSAPPDDHAPPREVEVLVHGAPLRQYAHGGRSYVEALNGREYAIRLRNPYDVRVAVALSVDGLNTIDARHTTAADARKWVLDPYQTLTIVGWQTNRHEARRFEFTTEVKSYSYALGATSNLGVISAVFFKERPPVTIAERRSDVQERGPGASAKPAPRAEAQALDTPRHSVDEYAATGMGQRTDHSVVQVWIDLEDKPALAVDIRYEFRAQLVKLGILPEASKPEPLARRERARGFEPGFAPVVK
jgi:hypothetical protein